MFSEKDFIEFLIFRNKFVVLTEILKYSPKKFDKYILVYDESIKSFNLVNETGNVISENEFLDNYVQISLSQKGKDFLELFKDGCFFEEKDIPSIIRKSLIYSF